MAGGIRPAAAAGSFYVEDGRALASDVDRLLGSSARWTGPRPWGVVVPHAGLRYSGPVAATAYAAAAAFDADIARVVVIGPSHFVPLTGCSVPTDETPAWRTPLGEVGIDVGLRATALRSGCVADDEAHRSEHSIEVQLPFLQRALGDGFRFLPVAVGRTGAGDVAALLRRLETEADLVVVSTDLSHYEDIARARRLDRRTAEAVQSLDADAIGPSDACGVYALRGAVRFAREAGMAIRLLELRTSGDTAGDADRVVGYGAFSITPRPGVPARSVGAQGNSAAATRR
jgi:AmmeMemoRadiSam system protein B